MAPVSLQLVFDAQQQLLTAGVVSIATGDVGLSYHGVDIVTHLAVKALRGQPILYSERSDIAVPDFYHPYKRGAARFKILHADEPFELHLVTDDTLGLHLSPTSIELGLTASSANAELRDLCNGVRDAALRNLTWPTLLAFLGGWLNLANVWRESEISIVYLMQTERLVDANDVDEAWCERSFKDEDCVEQAKGLLRGKRSRHLQSTWD